MSLTMDKETKILLI